MVVLLISFPQIRWFSVFMLYIDKQQAPLFILLSIRIIIIIVILIFLHYMHVRSSNHFQNMDNNTEIIIITTLVIVV